MGVERLEFSFPSSKDGEGWCSLRTKEGVNAALDLIERLEAKRRESSRVREKKEETQTHFLI